MQQSVNQRSGMDARAGVDHHAGGLIDGDEVVVFIEHRERDVLWRGLQRRERRGVHVDEFGAADCVGSTLGDAVNSDAPGFDPPLNTGATELGEAGVKEGIQPRAAVKIRRGEFQAAYLAAVRRLMSMPRPGLCVSRMRPLIRASGGSISSARQGTSP